MNHKITLYVNDTPFVYKNINGDIYINNNKINSRMSDLSKEDRDTLVLKSTYDELQKLLNLLSSDYYSSGSYENWCKVGMGLYNILGEEMGKELFIQFSKKKKDFNVDSIDLLWDSWSLPKGDRIGIGSFHYWAKLANLEGYQQQFQNYREKENVSNEHAELCACMSLAITKIIDTTQCDKALLFVSHYICSGLLGYLNVPPITRDIIIKYNMDGNLYTTDVDNYYTELEFCESQNNHVNIMTLYSILRGAQNIY